jgi:hypothetical protein
MGHMIVILVRLTTFFRSRHKTGNHAAGAAVHRQLLEHQGIGEAGYRFG